jgi:hypothetical protein
MGRGKYCKLREKKGDRLNRHKAAERIWHAKRKVALTGHWVKNSYYALTAIK